MNLSKPLCLLLCATLGACSKPEAPAAAPVPVPAPAAPAKPAPSADQRVEALLMRAVFGKAYRAASADALTQLAEPEQPGKRGNYVVNPVAHTILPNGETVLVANAQSAGADGDAESGHPVPGLLNVFFLKQTAAQWQVLKRQENIATLGASGQIGQAVWTRLGADLPALAMRHGDTAMGSSIEFLSLFDLGADTMRDLTESISIHSDNDGACQPDTDKCWNISGAWHFAPSAAGARYDDLLIDFSGESGEAKPHAELKEGDKVVRIVSKIHASARYAFDGKSYQLVEGENVVPGF
ncbi:hypothetical protein AAKU55_002805 [Oxalobacteraceae bacterium GrIS 1.11]